MKTILICLLILGTNRAVGSEPQNDENINWEPEGAPIVVSASNPNSSVFCILGANSFVRALCSKKAECDSCLQVYKYLLASQRTAGDLDACFAAVYELGIQAHRSRKEIIAEQTKILDAPPLKFYNPPSVLNFYNTKTGDVTTIFCSKSATKRL